MKAITRANYLFDRLLVAGLILLAVCPRLYLLVQTNSGIESDEAIVGLMAKHMLEGRAWPIFYYGQHYMGSLEAVLASGMFWLFGQTNHALKLVPLLFSLIHVGLVYYLARRFTDRFGAFVAALLTAMGPSALILWSLKARGGFIEVVVLGTYALLLSADILSQENASAKRWPLILLGLVLGLGWWVNNQIIYYIAAIAPIFCLHFYFRCRLIGGLKLSLWAALGFFCGSAPFWYANLFQKPYLSTFRTLLFQPALRDTGFIDHLSGFFSTGLPIIFGARRFWSENDIIPGSTGLLSLGYGVAFLVVFLVWAVGVWKRSKSGQSEPSYSLLILFCLSVALLFSVSSFGWLSKAPRYLLPLYSVLFILPGITASLVRRSAVRGSLLAAFLVVLLFLSANIASNYWGGLARPGQPFVFRGHRVSAEHAPLYLWLQENRYQHIRTNYWIGYRVAFETNEAITFSRFGTPRSLRIPEYERIDAAALSSSPYVLSPGEARLVARGLERFGLTYRYTRLGAYHLIDHVRAAVERGTPIPLWPGQIRASSRQDWVEFMVDGELGTRWGSGQPQHPEMWVEIDLDEPRTVTGIDLESGFFKQDAPRHLIVEGLSEPDGVWCSIFDSSGTKEFYDLNGNNFSEIPQKWALFFKPQRFKRLRLSQLGSTAVFDWSIAELRLYGADGES